MRPRLALLCAALAGVAARSAVLRGGGAVQAHGLSSPRSLVALRLRGGAEPSEELLQATFACNRLYAACLAEASAEVAMLRKAVAGAEELSGFGAKADAIITAAENRFAAGAPAGTEPVRLSSQRQRPACHVAGPSAACGLAEVFG